MAIFHMNVRTLSRSRDQSAILWAARCSASKFEEWRTGEVYDFERLAESVREAHVDLPDGAPERFRDRETLWNEVERCEKRRDAQLCREVEFALPRELNHDAQRELVRSYARERFVKRGMVADWSIHEGDGKNPHCHVLLSTREMMPDGFSAKKNREWNSRNLVEEWRKAYERDQNRALEREYVRRHVPVHERAYVDCRSYAERGIERVPQLHMGAAAWAMEQRERGRCESMGAEYRPISEKGKENARRLTFNEEVEAIVSKIEGLGAELAERNE